MNEDSEGGACSDFYEFSCGGYGGKPGQTTSVAQSALEAVYLYAKELLESSSAVPVSSFESARDLYQACMRFDGLHSERKESAYLLLELMDRFSVGNWPVVSTVYEDSELTISDRLAGLALLGVPVAFSAKVVPDHRKSGAYVLRLGPGGPLELGRSAIDIRKDHDLRTYMLFSLLLLGAPTYLRAATAVDDIISVDAYYATVQQNNEESCDTVDTLAPNEMTQLDKIMPEMNWTSLIDRIKREAGLRHNFTVEVHCKAKIRDYLVHLNDVTIRISHNYLGWRFFESFAKHVLPTFGRPPPHRSPSSPSSSSSSGGRGGLSTPRWKECVLLLERHAGPMLGLAMGKTFAKQGTEDKVSLVSRNTLRAAGELLQRTYWLREDQKRKIEQQVKDSIGIFTAPSRNRNSSSGPVFHLPAVSGDNYTSAVISLRKERVVQHLKKLDPATRYDTPTVPWEMYLTSEAKGTSSPLIFFDKIREPYIRLDGPDWMNYGGYGAFAAKERTADLMPDGGRVTHAPPGDEGEEGDEGTSLWKVWSRNRSASSCLRNLANKHFRTSMLRMDSKETLLKDLFLDAGALEIALQAARSSAKSGPPLPGMSHRSDEQMFYIAYAQTWCEEKHSETDAAHIPIRSRVNTLVVNSEGFASAFGCPASDKCSIWS